MKGNICSEGGNFVSLVQAEQEVADVYKLLHIEKWDVSAPHTGSGALEEVVKRVRHPRLLHIATHGFFCPDSESRPGSGGAPEDPMLRSGLLFAGASRAISGEPPLEGIENGILTA
jgi:hypothetical protein